MRTRHAVRLIVVSPDDRILLFRWMDHVEIHDPARPGASTYWNTPGGGIEAGETPEDAARRELFEETGIRDAHFGPRLWTSERVVHFPGWEMLFQDQATYLLVQETYLLVRVATTEVSFATHDAWEQRWMLAHRWWSLDELRDEAEAIVPAQLVTLVEPLLVGVTPPAPIRIDL